MQVLTLGLENTYADELEGLYVPFPPPGFAHPELLELNLALVDELGLDPDMVKAHAAALFSGSLVPTDSKPLAQAYAGHQFGGFSPQLGDGRAVLIGERRDRSGTLRDIQLKGSGRTPFSRGGDGQATVGPILREYLMGEAMHRLGVPTTRVLAAVATGERVWRSSELPGAVLARVASSHLRVGTVQFFAARGELDRLKRVVDYSLARHYPERVGQGNAARQLLFAVADAQAALIAAWMRVGFIHGVMNTDNSTLSGETIDYGPCAFLEVYDPTTAYSSIDHNGRYAYGNQPGIGQWNLARLGEALLPLLDDDEAAAIAHVEEALDQFVASYQAALLGGMRQKLGLDGKEEGDQALVTGLLQWMSATRQDFTLTFRRLAQGLRGKPAFLDPLFLAWRGAWVSRLGSQDRADTANRMDAVNPLYIARNHKVEEALDAAITGDLAPFRALLGILESPYEAVAGQEAYAEPAPPEFGQYQTFCGT